MSDDQRPSDPQSTKSAEPSDSAQHQRIGPYCLLQKLGEGGMGEVYEAEQEKPLRRRVALKIIKPGMDSRQVLARFEAERQALALMNHPNVAKVFDAGSTEQGRPYFAMELVKGEPITKYCDKHRLTTSERLKLFIQACEGVQHAHQKGIIHRDIKPSNVLVQIEGDKAVPKIIDFGIAKATEQRLTEQTVFTQLGQLIGTPEYMSPEQAEMTNQDIDTRTDVYSLGVILYELLVGALPFDSGQLRQAGFDEIRRIIRQDEPSKPSMRISTLGNEATPSAKRRQTDPAGLRRQLKGDLDWISMRALEKDRTRRYGSPTELRVDILRHLNNEPVLASPPSTAYRMGKFFRRHKAGTAIVCLVGLAMLGVGFGLLAVYSLKGSVPLTLLTNELTTISHYQKFMDTLFTVWDPSEETGNSVTARELLDKAAARIEQDFEDPLVQARLFNLTGRYCYQLGLVEQAGRHFAKALETREKLRGPEHKEVAESTYWLGRVYFATGDHEGARALYERALRIHESLLGPRHNEVAWDLVALADVLRVTGDHEGARAAYKRAIRILETKFWPEHRHVAHTQDQFAMMLMDIGEYQEARPLLERAVMSMKRWHGPNHPAVARVLYDRARLSSLEGNREDALEFLRQARDAGVVPLGIERDARFASLRGDPEFEAIAAELKMRSVEK